MHWNHKFTNRCCTGNKTLLTTCISHNDNVLHTVQTSYSVKFNSSSCERKCQNAKLNSRSNSFATNATNCLRLLAQDDTSNLQQMRLLVLINLKFITLVIHSKRSIATVYSACKDRSRIRLLCLLFKRSMQPSNRPLQITPKLYSRGRVTRSTLSPKCWEKSLIIKICSKIYGSCMGHGEKLLKYQEKRSGVYKMQGNSWRPGQGSVGLVKALPRTSLEKVAGLGLSGLGSSADAHLRLRFFGPHLSRPLIFRTSSELKL